MPCYNPSITGEKFHSSEKFVRLLLGPLGSGKSVTCLMDILSKAHSQMPNASRERKTRWAVIRNSYRELQDTTLNTFWDWIPRDLGLYKAQDVKYHLRSPLADGTILDMEILFRALDKPSDVKKLLSLELTGAFINEAREVPKQILDMLMGRVGRYPNKRDGGPTWWGVIMDTNPPDSDHWIYKVFEEDKPENYEIFKQPSGLSSAAENIENLPPKYYQNMIPGKDQEWVNIYVHGKYGFMTDGNPVYLEYNDDVHYVPHVLEPVKGKDLFVGIDFGLTPAAAIAQEINGQWRFIDEITSRDMGALRFGEFLGKHLRRHYRGYTLIITGDPAGEQRAQTDERTPFDILSAVGIEAEPAHTNDYTIRRETFAMNLSRMTFTGEPGIVIGPNCKMLRKGLAGGYKFRRVQVSGEEKYVEKPDKNIYSHICEAAQYLLLGAGMDDQLLGADQHNWNLDYTDLNRASV